jgi:hypothetical protein
MVELIYMILFEDQTSSLINACTVTFWCTNDEGYREPITIIMVISAKETWPKIEKVLKSRYIDPELISVKLH